MKTKQIQITKESLGSIDLSPITSINPQLGFVFGTKEMIDESGVLKALKSDTQAQWLGCTTAGEITQDGVFDNSITITAIHFDNPDVQFKIESCEIDGNDTPSSINAGAQLASQLDPQNLTSVMIFSPGLEVNGSSIISGFQSELKTEIPITGGLAGDGGAFQTTYTIFNEKMGERQLLALGFYGDNIKMTHGCQGGWTPFGVERKVTKAQDNVLFELDGEPALDIYKTYLGDQASDLPGSGLMFPISLVDSEAQGNDLIRTILGIDETNGSLTLAGDIPEGKIVRLMHASNEGLINGAKGAAENIASNRNDEQDSFAILVSCVGRKLVLGPSTDEEVETIADLLGENCCLTGFYSYGEISPFNSGKKGVLHNQTMTIAHISES